ncbi:hypothetical protein EVAR_64954_1 [Eumeta japonica]|uniref:Uncharacterized protein n=1 Tax=Eumeta variegata TaxID=151549 RepID=A0A4C1ZFG2_EUMVA|nr:hypothetical protein EVAR_64954_1 [Eumeta japonica]
MDSPVTITRSGAVRTHRSADKTPLCSGRGDVRERIRRLKVVKLVNSRVRRRRSRDRTRRASSQRPPRTSRARVRSGTGKSSTTAQTCALRSAAFTSGARRLSVLRYDGPNKKALSVDGRIVRLGCFREPTPAAAGDRPLTKQPAVDAPARRPP